MAKGPSKQKQTSPEVVLVDYRAPLRATVNLRTKTVEEVVLRACDLTLEDGEVVFDPDTDAPITDEEVIAAALDIVDAADAEWPEWKTVTE